jgi:DsbC/DsbD-like thiol-disulfide interchange protein
MPAGWKTYWRMPGEAGGIPPEFDWSASENLASANVLYPAPKRLTDKSGTAVGYHDRAVFPVAIAASDPAKPIELRLKAAYGVCKDICVPAEAELSLTIPVGRVAPQGEIQAALDSVPRRTPKQGADPVLKSWTLDAIKRRLVLQVDDPGAGAGDALVEAPDGLYLPLPKLVEAKGPSAIYDLDLGDGVDLKTLAGKPLTVTLIGAKGQSETMITLK